MKKPYVVLLDPVSGRGAAYNGQHKLMSEEASAALVRFAVERHTKHAPWSDEEDAKRPRERAPWMPEGSLAGWALYWLRDGNSSAQHLRETPDR